jgi:Tol biopolymer transport system component
VAGALAGAGSAGTNGIGTGNLVFSAIDSSDGMSDIYVMNADGTAQTNITHDKGIRKDQSPSWSPNGSKIAFTRSTGGGTNLLVINADGSGLTKVTPPSMAQSQNVAPSWSPDGTRIVFSSNYDGNYELYSLKLGSPYATQLTKTSAPIQNLDPAWSPSGSAIVFSQSGNPAGTASPSAELYQLKLGSTLPSRLTRTIRGQGDVAPSYSPDGTQIAFSSDRAGNSDVYLLDLAARSVTQLTTSTKSDTQPSFAPDGSAVVFVSTRSGATELWAQSLATFTPGPPEPIQLTSDGQSKADPGWASPSYPQPVGPPSPIEPPAQTHPGPIGPPVPVPAPVPVFQPPTTRLAIAVQ